MDLIWSKHYLNNNILHIFDQTWPKQTMRICYTATASAVSCTATSYKNSQSACFSVAGPKVWDSLPDSLCDLAVESERFSAGLENADLCRTLETW